MESSHLLGYTKFLKGLGWAALTDTHGTNRDDQADPNASQRGFSVLSQMLHSQRAGAPSKRGAAPAPEPIPRDEMTASRLLVDPLPHFPLLQWDLDERAA
ncbi:hypothetical protein LZ31DRAFT_349743 [Colletotrichum somersetense]|nr:hypothetical protein LZ31DRAFT_349743 [Colletotrichum somersetense]